jgi:dTDP-4-amino-4,6-dideoxy-D-galactose acyltransferase
MTDIQPLAWDSEFWGFPVGRLQATTLRHEDWPAIRESSRELGIRCLYFLADPTDAETVVAAEACGMHYADTRMTFARKLDVASLPATVRPATTDDIEALVPLARVGHKDSRFFFDPGFDRHRCGDLYETWLRRSLEGFADRTLVAVHNDRPVGYMTLHRRQTGQVGIIAIDEAARGLGLGRALIEAAHATYLEWGLEEASVVTQLRNIAAQRLYQANGYRIAEVGHWFHAWLDR